MRQRPELDLPDYVRDRRTGACDIICSLGIATGLVFMLALVSPKGLEPGEIDALIEQQYRSAPLVTKIASHRTLLSDFCPDARSA